MNTARKVASDLVEGPLWQRLFGSEEAEALALLRELAGRRSEVRLPRGLAARVRAIPTQVGLRLPRAQRRLPRRLAVSLRSLSPTPRPLLPRFLASPLYSLVTSYAIVIVISIAWGNPYVRLQSPLGRAEVSAISLLESGESAVSEMLREARSEVSEGERHARALVLQIKNHVFGVGRTLTTASPEDDRDAERTGN